MSYPRRQLINTDKKPKCLNNVNSENLRIAQWNIYAQGFVVSDGFQYCTPGDMQLGKRMKMFRKEFSAINADIYCLQEADIHANICSLLNEDGIKYEDIFCPKAESPCLMYSGNFGPDGCCIIYNKNRLECIHRLNLNLDTFGSYVSLFAIFRFKSNPKLNFIVVCAHLKSKKAFQTIRSEQCKILLAKLHELMSLWDITSGFVCGDFNADPSESVIKEMQESLLNLINVYDYLRTDQNVEEFYTSWVFKKDECLSKRIGPVTSAYINHNHISAEELNSVKDYMWFFGSPSYLPQIDSTLTTVLWPLSIEDVPKKSDIGPHGIPAVERFPSDHMSLVADYIIGTISP